jgi:hypothetical protein
MVTGAGVCARLVFGLLLTLFPASLRESVWPFAKPTKDMFFKPTRSGAAAAGWRASSSNSTRALPSTISLFQPIRL